MLSVGTGAHVRGVTRRPSVLLQDGNVRLYSILGTTLKDEGKLLEAKGPVTDLAFSHNGAFLAVCDASKVVTVFSVADGYSVSGRAACLGPTPGSTDGRRGPQPLSLVITDGAGAQDTQFCCSQSVNDVGQGGFPCRPAVCGLVAKLPKS